MIFKKSKKILSAVLSLAMIGTMFASVPLSASADDTATDTTASDIGVSYSAHVQSIGWQTAVSDGALAGTTGKAKRVEALKVNLTGDDLPDGASITYQAHVQSYGWMTAVSDGAIAGTSGKSKRIEALKLTLSGLDGYSVEYRVHQQTYGWSDWVTTTNGTDIADAVAAGVTGKSKRVEAVEIKVVKGDGSGDDTPTPTEDLKISSIASSSATAFAVTFNRAVTDTAAITATVKKNAITDMKVAATWNSDNTVMTLTYSSKLPAASYTVNVLNGEDVLGTDTVTVTAQKVAKIELGGDTLSVAPTTSTNSSTGGGDGYISYTVYDQYGVDITTSSLATQGNITWTCSVGSITASKGLITVTSFSKTTYLSTYTSATITAIDSTSGAQLSKTVTVDVSKGLIGSVSLNGVVDSDGSSDAEIVGYDTTDLLYIDYTATDANGNSTKKYKLLSSAMISSDTTSGMFLYSSNPTILKAELVQDSDDSSNAVIKLEPQSAADDILVDQTVMITYMTTSGKQAQLNVTVKKPSALDTITLDAPADSVAVGETPELSFEAFDQDGDALTSYSTILAGISGSSGLDFSKNTDGSMCIKLNSTTTASSGSKIVQIYTSTGKSASLNITVVDEAYPVSLKLDSSVIKQFMQIGSYQNVGFGNDNHYGLSCLDQYGRSISLKNKNIYKYSSSVTTNVQYRVLAEGTGVKSTNTTAALNDYIVLNAASSTASNTIKFELQYSTDGSTWTTVDTKTTTLTTLADAKIVGATADECGTLYAAAAAKSSYSYTNSNDMYASYKPSVYGLTSSGAKVVLADDAIKSWTVDNDDFGIKDVAMNGWTATKAIVAYKDSDSTTTTGTLTAVVQTGTNTYTAKIALNASSASPVPASTGISATSTSGNANTGVSVSGNTVYLTKTAAASLMSKSLERYNSSRVDNGNYDSNIYLTITTQYNGLWMNSEPFAYFTASDITTFTSNNTTVNKYSIDKNTGVISLASGATTATGDTFTVNGVTANGLIDTVKFVVTDDTATVFASHTTSVANDLATLGMVGTAVTSSATTVATAAISNGNIVITSVKAGSTTLTVSKTGSTSTATIDVVVDGNGVITATVTNAGSTMGQTATLAQVDGLGFVSTDTVTLGTNTTPAVATATWDATAKTLTLTSVAKGTTYVTLTAGTTTKYVTVTVAATGGVTTSVSATSSSTSDTTLKSLTVGSTAVTLTGATTYNVTVPNGTTTVPTTVAVANSTASTVAVTNASSLSGHTTIIVTANDGTTATYTVTFTKAAASTDSSLKSINIDGVALTGFAAATLTYTDVLPVGTASTYIPTITATATDSTATVLVTDVTGVPGTATIKVTAQDGTTTTTYTINFTVAVTTAATPVIGTQPADAAVASGNTGALTIVATVADTGTLSYQWYSNTTNSATGGTLLTGATSASYTTAALTTTTYYYCVVTNTNDAATDTKTATITSSVATLTVS